MKIEELGSKTTKIKVPKKEDSDKAKSFIKEVKETEKSAIDQFVEFICNRDCNSSEINYKRVKFTLKRNEIDENLHQVQKLFCILFDNVCNESEIPDMEDVSFETLLDYLSKKVYERIKDKVEHLSIVSTWFGDRPGYDEMSFVIDLN